MGKDVNWLLDKIEEIKTKKRALKWIEDPNLVKKMKADLKREYRGAKRSEKNSLKVEIWKEILGEEEDL
jgi:hypothetical protein